MKWITSFSHPPFAQK
jgi:hypothetical protein